MKKIKGYIKRFLSGLCGLNLYYEGCGCKQCIEIQINKYRQYQEELKLTEK